MTEESKSVPNEKQTIEQGQQNAPLGDLTLVPVKKKPGLLLRVGLPLCIGGTVVVLIGSYLSAPTMGMPRSRRLAYEQRQEDIRKAEEAENKSSVDQHEDVTDANQVKP